MAEGTALTLTDKVLNLIDGPQKGRGALQRFGELLPQTAGITPSRFAAMAGVAFNRNPDLWKCSPASIMECLVLAAQSGLSVSGIGGEAYMIPYGGKATFVPGYRGLMKVAMRSGKVKSIDAGVVYSNEVSDPSRFDYKKGSGAFLMHRPLLSNRGTPVAVWAYALLADGGEQFVVLPIEEVEKVRASSKSGKGGPWREHYDEMAKKTALRRLCKYLPMSDDEAVLIEAAGREEAGLDPDPIDDRASPVGGTEESRRGRPVRRGAVVDTSAVPDGTQSTEEAPPADPLPSSPGRSDVETTDGNSAPTPPVAAEIVPPRPAAPAKPVPPPPGARTAPATGDIYNDKLFG